MNSKKAVIIGAGPAGLTAAYELLEHTNIKPVVYEMSNQVGGIAKTVNYKGNRLDIGGHRFFSKSDVVMQWWQKILPIQGSLAKDDLKLNITYHNKSRQILLSKDGPDPEKTDKVLLIRNRKSRIYFMKKFFDYPITMNYRTVKNLGLFRLMKIGISYLRFKISPIRQEKSLEDFYINRFGKELYKTFFKDYTEKVWGLKCHEIKPEWGAQRVKGLSITKALIHAVKNMFTSNASVEQKSTETSLIEQFLYPKFGPGHMWEEVANSITSRGGEIILNHRVREIYHSNHSINKIVVENLTDHNKVEVRGDYFFSSMPISELINNMVETPPVNVVEVATGLKYRDFVIVGLLVEKLKIKNETGIKTINDIIPDNWIYIQERGVKLGRLQIFNNWSPYMVKDEDTVWLGLEYFCNEGDELWSKSDQEFIEFASMELAKIGIIEREKVLDGTIVRVPKTYPAYFGSYDRMSEIRDYTDKFENLFLVGRNGMHKYNNQDHSMLTAITAVQNIKNDIKSKDAIWSVNTEMEYHESKTN